MRQLIVTSYYIVLAETNLVIFYISSHHKLTLFKKNIH